MDWRKSTFSGSNGSCVEVAAAGSVAVRDTTDQGQGVMLTFGASAWRAFLDTLR
jgi:hypothetical protein